MQAILLFIFIGTIGTRQASCAVVVTVLKHGLATDVYLCLHAPLCPKQARCNLSNPVNNDYQGAYDFRASSGSALDLDMYYNETLAAEGGGGAPVQTARLPGPLSDAVAAWWAAAVGGGAGGAGVADWPGIRLLGIMTTPKQSSKLDLDFSSLLGPLFYTWVVQLLLPTFLQQLVGGRAL